MALTTVVFWGLTYANLITIASIAYQVAQARKMKKAAKEAAEARKGFEIVVEGEAVNLPIVYGRAKVGGARTYHNVSNNFNYVTPNSDKVLKTVGLDENYSGQKNEFLLFQQALCQGPINNVYDVVFDEGRYLNDPDVGFSDLKWYDTGGYDESGNYSSSITSSGSFKAGLRIDLHYGNTPKADAIASANFGERSTAVFDGLAYASTVIKLNRDEPQFNNVPMQQFFIEGKKVRSVLFNGSTYSLNSTRVYSNNPAYCLLDYLLDDMFGKGLSVSQIDLKSFYDAAQICDTVVQSNATVGGKIFTPTLGGTGAAGVTGSTRNIKLYECNIVVDTQKPIRENVETLLSTMGDARLVWSSGTYKLNMQYPTSNSVIAVAATITDDDLIIDDTISINWPTTSERLNNCTVRFHNESENFKEDTVAWPPKTSGTFLRGVGGFKYPIQSDLSNTSITGVQFLNSVGVWNGSGNETSLVYKMVVKETGTYLLEYNADDALRVIITGSGLNYDSGIQGNWRVVKTANINLVKDTVYTINISANNTGGEKSVGAKLSRNNYSVWTTRSDAYTDFITVNASSAVYDAMKLEDSGLELETDIFADGITDYYHALAKAEELVRTSRTAFGVKFKYLIKNQFLEPGDFIQFSSNTLKLGLVEPFYLRVNEVKIVDGSNCEVTATRFDYTQLAWNQKDNEYLKPNNVYSFTTSIPNELIYTPDVNNLLNSVGTLTWPDTRQSNFQSYVLYMYAAGNVDDNQEMIFEEIGRSSTTSFVLPALRVKDAVFGLRVLTKEGRLSSIVLTGTETLPIYNPSAIVEIQSTGPGFIKSALNDVVAPATQTLTVNATQFRSPVYSWYVDETLIEGANTDTLVVNQFTNTNFKTYNVVVTEEGTSYFAEDSTTLYYLSESSNAYTFGFSNESISLTANENGVPTSGQLPYQVTVTTVKGAAVVDPATITYDIEPLGCTATINTQGIITITAVADPFAYISVTVIIGDVTLNKNITISKSIAGQTGQTAIIARISASRGAFITPKNTTTVTPASIRVTDLSSGLISPVREWYIDDVLQTGVTTSFIDIPSFSAGLSKRVRLFTYESGNTLKNSQDNLTIYSIAEGSDSYVLGLNDENRTIPASTDGVPNASYLPFTVNPIVVRGTDLITTNSGITYSLTGINNLAATINSSTGLVTITAVNASFGSVTINAAIPNGPTLQKVLTVSLALAGVEGSSVRVVFIRSATQPLTPSASPSTPSGWYASVDLVPASSNLLWSSVGLKAVGATNFTWQTPVQVEGRNGNPGVSAYLTNPTHDLLANPSGTVYAAEYTSASTDFIVLEGGTASTGWSFFVSAITPGLSYKDANDSVARTAIGSTNGILDTLPVSIASLTVDSGYLDITATKAGYSNITLRFSVTRISEAADGISPVLVNLTGPQAISYNKDGLTPTPSSLSFTATGKNVSGTMFYRFKVDDVVLGAIKSSNTGTVTSDVYTSPTSHFTTPKLVTVEISTSSTMSPILDTDSLSLVTTRVGQTGNTGASGVAAYLTNPTHDLLANPSGTVYPSEYATATTNFSIFEGGTVATGWSFHVSAISANTFYKDADDASQRSGTGTINGAISAMPIGISSLTADSGYLDITATKTGYSNITLRFSVTRISEAADGVSPIVVSLTGQQAISYDKLGATASPSSITFTANARNLPSGTYFYRFSVDGTTVGSVISSTTGTADSSVYSSPTTFFSTPKLVKVEIGTTASISPVLASDSMSLVASKVGADGTSVAELTIFKRSSTAITIAPTGGSYSFDSTTLTPPSTWSTGVPTGSDPVYASRTVASSDTVNGVDSSLTWSTPVLTFQNGTSPYIGDLSNDNHTLPASSTGVISSYSGASGTFSVFLGSTAASGVTFEYLSSSGFSTAPSTSINSTTGAYSITGSSTGGVISSASDVATVTYVAKVAGATVSIQTFSISKQKAALPGVDATVKFLESSVSTINLNGTLTAFSPSAISFNSYSITGNAARVNFPAKFVLESSTTGAAGSWTAIRTTENVSSETLLTSTLANTVRFIKVSLYEGTTLLDEEVITVVVSGAKGDTGEAARGVTLSVTSGGQAFNYNSSGSSPSPASTVITATPSNTVGTVFYQFFKNGVSTGSPSTTATYTYTPTTLASSMPERVEVRIREGLSTNPVLATDTMSFFAVVPGEKAITVTQTNFGKALSANSSGVVFSSSYVGTGVSFQAFEGSSPIAYGTNFTVTAVGAGITPNASPTTLNTFTRVYGDASNMSATDAKITYTITVINSAGVSSTYTREQVFSKTTDGAAGQPGSTGNRGVASLNTSATYSDPGTSSQTTGSLVGQSLQANLNSIYVNLADRAPRAGDIGLVFNSLTKSVRLTSDTYLVTYTTGVPSIFTVRLTATPVNTSGTVYYTFYKNNVKIGTTSTTDFVDVSIGGYIAPFDVFSVTIQEGSTTGEIISTDTLELYYQTAFSGIGVVHTNSYHELPIDNNGTISNYTGSGTTISVYQNNTKLTYSASGGTGTFSVTPTVSSGSITIGAATTVNNERIFANHSLLNSTSAIISYQVNTVSLAGIPQSFTVLQEISRATKGNVWSRTYYFDGSLWTSLAQYIDGNSVITGTLSVGALKSGAAGVNVINQYGNSVRGSFSLGSAETAPVGNTSAIATFTSENNNAWALLASNTFDQVAVEYANGIAGVTKSPQGAGIGAYTVVQQTPQVTNMRTAAVIAETNVGGYFINMKPSSYTQSARNTNLDSRYRRSDNFAATANYVLRGTAFGNLENLGGNENELGPFVAELAYCSDDQTSGFGALFVRRHISGPQKLQEAARIVIAPSWAPTRAIEVSSGFAYQGTVGHFPGGITTFTGVHEGQSEVPLTIGDIVIDKQILFKLDIANVFSEVIPSASIKDKRVIGVVAYNEVNQAVTESDDDIDNTVPELGFSESTVSIAKELEPWKLEYTVLINAVGEGQVNVCGENGNIEVGDLIVTSSIAGKGMRQDDDLIRSYTVAKARESVTFDSPTEVKMIACTYLCG
jgi:hypothetical protein